MKEQESLCKSFKQIIVQYKNTLTHHQGVQGTDQLFHNLVCESPLLPSKGMVSLVYWS